MSAMSLYTASPESARLEQLERSQSFVYTCARLAKRLIVIAREHLPERPPKRWLPLRPPAACSSADIALCLPKTIMAPYQKPAARAAQKAKAVLKAVPKKAIDKVASAPATR